MGLHHIVTPLDSAVLQTKQQYAVYFKIVNDAFSKMVVHLEKEAICSPAETTYIKQYCDLLTYTLEAFRIKYLFDDEEKMKIDLTESGFPHYSEFRYLVNDMELKKEHMAKLPPLDSLKEDFLESLLKHKKPISDRLLHQAASVAYYTSVKQEYLFKRFVQGKVTKTASSEETEYMISWAFYDVSLNRPFICLLYFDLHKVHMVDYLQDVYDVLEQTADRNMTLDTMAYAIDKKLPNLWPRKLKKIDLGPIHSIFAKDELEITHSLLEAIGQKTLDLSAYAVSLSIETAVSKGNFKEGNFFNKQYLQVWESQPKQDFVFTSHRVMQLLYDKIPEKMHSLSKDPIAIEPLKL